MVPKLVSLANFPKKGIHLEGSVPLEAEVFEKGYVYSIKKILIDLYISKIESIFFVRGLIEEELQLVCSRCLEPFSYKEKIEIYHRLQEEEDLQEDAFQIINEIFKPYDMVRELIDVNLPMKPLCNENCKGLCSRCGANLNKEGCDCPK